MNKRSAVLMALGLTAALIAGGIAVAAGAAPEVGEAVAGTGSALAREPEVRTRIRTVTIHRQAGGAGDVVVDGTASVSGQTSGAPSSHSGDDAFDDHGDDGFDDDRDEGDDHDVSDDHGGEGDGDEDHDNSGPGSDSSGSGSDSSGHGGGDDDD